jgi:hypothetical protein
MSLPTFRLELPEDADTTYMTQAVLLVAAAKMDGMTLDQLIDELAEHLAPYPQVFIDTAILVRAIYTQTEGSTRTDESTDDRDHE